MRLRPAAASVADMRLVRAATERSVPALALARPRIPVVSGPRLIEMAALERVLTLLEAPNAKPVVAHKAIAAIQLLEFGNDERLSPRYGNPQALSHDAETDENPRGVWTFKKLPPKTA
jgi:hypothetical protein